jgi:hypothetical protein
MTGGFIQLIAVENREISCMALTDNDKFIFSGNLSTGANINRITCYSAEHFCIKKTYKGHTKYITSCVLSKNR